MTDHPAHAELAPAAPRMHRLSISMKKHKPAAHESQDSLLLRGRLGHLTTEQEATLNELKEMLKNENLFDPETMDDHTLLRFLRARKFDLQKTMLMFTNYIKWRKEFGVDELTKSFDFPEREEVHRVYPRYYHKQDKDGRPVWIEHLGTMSSAALLRITTEQRLFQSHVVEFEKFRRLRLPASSYKLGRHIEQSCTILDLKGVSLTQFPQCASMVKKISALSQDYYPETLGKMYIVNAPMLFAGVWNVVKHFLDENTIAKIHIVSSNYKEMLLAQIPAENLPVELGGTCSCQGGCRTSDAGPWKDTESDWEKVRAFEKLELASHANLPSLPGSPVPPATQLPPV